MGGRNDETMARKGLHEPDSRGVDASVPVGEDQQALAPARGHGRIGKGDL